VNVRKAAPALERGRADAVEMALSMAPKVSAVGGRAQHRRDRWLRAVVVVAVVAASVFATVRVCSGTDDRLGSDSSALVAVVRPPLVRSGHGAVLAPRDVTVAIVAHAIAVVVVVSTLALAFAAGGKRLPRSRCWCPRRGPPALV